MSHGGRLISLALFFTLYACHDFSPPFFISLSRSDLNLLMSGSAQIVACGYDNFSKQLMRHWREAPGAAVHAASPAEVDLQSILNCVECGAIPIQVED
jgi:hypothetical protein